MSGIFGFHIEEKEKTDIHDNTKRIRLWNEAYGNCEAEIFQGKEYVCGCCADTVLHENMKNKPILHKNGKVAVLDVILYNAKELMEKCEITEKMSHEELLFTYIEKFGLNGLCDVNADMAGAIWDENSQTLSLFRDHMGIRPLFYYEKNNEIVFSTDIRGITALPFVDASINEAWIYRTVNGYSNISVENTEFSHIFCVPNGGYVTFTFDKTVKKETKLYWEVGKKKIRFRTEQEYFDEMKRLVTDAIKRRVDVVPGVVGAELSGGLDSGIIDILINRLGKKGIYFSWSASPNEVPMAENDERLVIEDICKQENITCHYGKENLELRENTAIAENIKRINGKVCMEEPESFRYALPPYINALTISETSEFINKSGAKVVFTGHGGDEGISHRCNVYEMFYNKEYYHFLRYVWSLSHGQKGRISKTLKSSQEKIKELNERKKIPFKNAWSVPDLLNAEFAAKFDKTKMPIITFVYDPKTYVRSGGSRNRLDNVALLGAYSGVRYMVPYLDYRVIDFALSIPRHMYLKRGKNRYIFRETFKDIMPKSLYSLRFKEDNSRKNMVRDENWYDEFAKRKQQTVDKLDREYWSKYLNFDKVDEWLKRGKPSEEEEAGERNILMCLFYCAMLQNLVEKSRDIS